MILKSIRLYHYQLPLKKPFIIKGKALKIREGLILEFKNESGQVGYGEIAPLPGISKETLKQAESQIQNLSEYLKSQSYAEKSHLHHGDLSQWRQDLDDLFPSVQMGIESALLMLLASKQKKTIAQLLDQNPRPRVPVNGLAQGNLKELLREVELLLQSGYQSIKLKLGSEELSKDIEKVKQIDELIQDKAMLRLDINQSWNFDEAVDFVNEVGIRNIEYIEEPFKDIERIPDFFQQTLIPVALDESLRMHDWETIKHLEGAEIVVLKPMVLGGIDRTWEIADLAHSQGMQVIISSSFESALGMYVNAQCSASFAKGVTAGLDTGHFFQTDLLDGHALVEHAHIDLDHFPVSEIRLKKSGLKEVA